MCSIKTTVTTSIIIIITVAEHSYLYWLIFLTETQAFSSLSGTVNTCTHNMLHWHHTNITTATTLMAVYRWTWLAMNLSSKFLHLFWQRIFGGQMAKLFTNQLPFPVKKPSSKYQQCLSTERSSNIQACVTSATQFPSTSTGQNVGTAVLNLPVKYMQLQFHTHTQPLHWLLTENIWSQMHVSHCQLSCSHSHTVNLVN